MNKNWGEVNGREGACRSDGTLGLRARSGNLESGGEKTGEGEAFYRVTRRRSTSQGGKTSSPTCSEGEGPNFAVVCVCGLRGFPFRGPLGPKLGTCASPSKVDKRDMTGQPVGDYMIGLSEDEREGA